MNFNRILLAVILMSVIGCNQPQQNTNNSNAILINPDQNVTKKLSEYSEYINIVNLNRPNTDIIGEINVVKTFGDYIFIHDALSTALLCYDRNSGNIKFSIKDKGRGPGEIQLISDFRVNELENVLEVMDSGNRKLLKFAFDGSFISESQTGFLGHYFESIDPNSYVIYSNYQQNENNCNLYIVDKHNFKVKTILLPISKGYEDFSLLYHVHFNKSGENRLLFSEMHDNKIYCIENNSLKVKYQIDFKDKNIPSEIKKELSNNPPPMNQMIYLNKLSESEYCHSIHSFFEINGLLGFIFAQNKKVKVFLRNSKSKSAIIDKIILDNNIELDSKFVLLKDGYMYLVINGPSMVQYQKTLYERFKENEIQAQNQSNSFLSELFKISEDVNEDSNPCIIEVKIKL